LSGSEKITCRTGASASTLGYHLDSIEGRFQNQLAFPRFSLKSSAYACCLGLRWRPPALNLVHLDDGWHCGGSTLT
jgi:hypothetical protein